MVMTLSLVPGVGGLRVISQDDWALILASREPLGPRMASEYCKCVCVAGYSTYTCTVVVHCLATKANTGFTCS